RWAAPPNGSERRCRASPVRLAERSRRLRGVGEAAESCRNHRQAVGRSYGQSNRCLRLFAGVKSKTGIESVLPEGLHLGKLGSPSPGEGFKNVCGYLSCVRCLRGGLSQ